MSVVKEMRQRDAPIYTVHDNFVSTAHHSWMLPGLYTLSFSRLDPPLRVINQFIYENVISPVLGRPAGLFSRDTGPSWRRAGAFDLDRVFSSTDLAECLHEGIPGTVNRKLMKDWSGRIQNLVKAYEAYTGEVCGPN